MSDEFLDIGSGLPTMDNTHSVAQRINPDAKVVYVDNDPIVLAHARAILQTNQNTRVITADMREPQEILNHPEVEVVVPPLVCCLIPVVTDRYQRGSTAACEHRRRFRQEPLSVTISGGA